MQFTQLSPSHETVLRAILDKYPIVAKIIPAIVAVDGMPLLVGGAVRDLFIGDPIKDLDIELHGLSLEKLEHILRAYGAVRYVGKSFGVLRLNGLDIDWSLPRTDSIGRKPKVTIDPDMGIRAACARRDLTINAMCIDLHTLRLYDPFHGRDDLAHKRLRAPDISFFADDPLRFYRVMQFISRFQMYPDEELEQQCKRMTVDTVSIERIEIEFNKMLLRSRRPSLGLRWLADIGRMQELFPELYALIGVEQDVRWHLEGDVFEHTMQTVDAASTIACSHEQERLLLLYAALCHDLGKVSATEKDGDRVISHGHDISGVAITQQFLSRIVTHKQRIASVKKMVRYHMAPVQFVADGAKAPAYKRLAHKLAPDVTIKLLASLACADKRGRNPDGPEPLQVPCKEVEQFLLKAEKAQVLEQKEEPLVRGADIMPYVSPGPEMGKLLKKAYEMQLEEGIVDASELLEKLLKKNGSRK